MWNEINQIEIVGLKPVGLPGEGHIVPSTKFRLLLLYPLLDQAVGARQRGQVQGAARVAVHHRERGGDADRPVRASYIVLLPMPMTSLSPVDVPAPARTPVHHRERGGDADRPVRGGRGGEGSSSEGGCEERTPPQ